MRPRTVVETGVANGYSTTFMLAALHENGAGRLYSINWRDPARYLPRGRAVGWLVPDELRAGWELIEGRTRDVLPPLLEKLGGLDLFLHDSDHSRANQAFELTLAWNALPIGGVMSCDDVGASDAFDSTLAGAASWSTAVAGRLGVAIKKA